MFQTREHAGRLLAARLEHLRAARPVVLGLSRGGIPVAYEVARLLAAPLDLVVVRKSRAPGATEVVLGVLAEGGETFLDPAAARERGIEPVDLGALAEREVAELWRRIRIYRGDAPAPSLAGRAVIVVDDFIATGTTIMAANRNAVAPPTSVALVKQVKPFFSFTKIPVGFASINIAPGPNVTALLFTLETTGTKSTVVTQMAFQLNGNAGPADITNFRLVYFPNGLNKPSSIS